MPRSTRAVRLAAAVERAKREARRHPGRAVDVDGLPGVALTCRARSEPWGRIVLAAVLGFIVALGLK